jgi:hypothetical protein
MSDRFVARFIVISFTVVVVFIVVLCGTLEIIRALK